MPFVSPGQAIRRGNDETEGDRKKLVGCLGEEISATREKRGARERDRDGETERLGMRDTPTNKSRGITQLEKEFRLLLTYTLLSHSNKERERERKYICMLQTLKLAATSLWLSRRRCLPIRRVVVSRIRCSCRPLASSLR